MKKITASFENVENAALWIVKIGLWIIPFLPIYISSSMLFPFITGKNFTFRIMVEVMFALWVGLAVAVPDFRPRLTRLFKAVTIFIGIVFLADLFGPNPYRSFFSNYERMEGFMMLGHLYLYFVMLSSVFRSRRDWLVFFHTTLLASAVVSFIGLSQKLGYQISLQGGFRVDSTIGNPIYLAAYLLFHIWLLVILIKQFWKLWWLRILYIALCIFELAILYFTATRGAVLALVIVAIPFLGAVVLWWPRIFAPHGRDASHRANGWMRGRKIALAVFAFSVALPLAFWLLRTSDFVRSSPVLNRLTNYSLDETTVKSRFMIWHMSGRAALDRPILGWGQENYYLVFQKYYDPRLYGQEPWFDRSHDIIFDWLVAGGVVGLLSYLAVLGTVAWTLIVAMRKKTLLLWEGLVLAALFLTHFLQNIFVFDNLNTYLLFFGFLAYTGYAAAGDSEDAHHASPHTGKLPQSALWTWALCLVAASASIYFLQISGIREGMALIDALRVTQQKGATLAQMQSAFEKALAYHSFGDGEVREQIGNAARNILNGQRGTPEERLAFTDFAVREMRKETERPAKDIKHLLFLASILSAASPLHPAYAPEAEAVLQEAIQLSPTKQILYFELGQLYLRESRFKEALQVLAAAQKLEPHYVFANQNLVVAAALAGDRAAVDTGMAALDLKSVDEATLARIGEFLRGDQVKAYDSALRIYQELASRAPQNPQYHATLAALFGQLGRTAEAVQEAQKAAALDPARFGHEAPLFIQQMRQNSR